MHPSVLRTLEDLLRRVLRSPQHGIDVATVSAATRGRVARERQRREAALATVLSLAAALVLLGWFLAEWFLAR